MNRNTTKCFPSLFLTLGRPYMLKNTLNHWTPDLDILQIFKCSSILSGVEKSLVATKIVTDPAIFSARKFSIGGLLFADIFPIFDFFVQYGYTAV